MKPAGSAQTGAQAYITAIKQARETFDVAEKAGYQFSLLDIGGGFEYASFSMFAPVIKSEIERQFAPSVRVIAEPGRFLVSNAFSLACKVIARRTMKRSSTESLIGSEADRLYQNCGVFGQFMNCAFEDLKPVPHLLHQACRDDGTSKHERAASEFERTYHCSIWGPTCDGADLLNRKCVLPSEVQIGDWLSYDNMGGS